MVMFGHGMLWRSNSCFVACKSHKSNDKFLWHIFFHSTFFHAVHLLNNGSVNSIGTVDSLYVLFHTGHDSGSSIGKSILNRPIKYILQIFIMQCIIAFDGFLVRHGFKKFGQPMVKSMLYGFHGNMF